MKPQFWLIALFALLLVGTALADDKSDSLAIVMSKDSTLDNVSMPELIKIFRGATIARRDEAGARICWRPM